MANLGGIDVRLFLSGRRPPDLDSTGHWGMGDDAWRGQSDRCFGLVWPLVTIVNERLNFDVILYPI